MSIATDQKVKELLVRVTQLENDVTELTRDVKDVVNALSRHFNGETHYDAKLDKRSLEYRKSIGRS